MEGGYDFPFLGSVSSNIRLKWLSICLNIDYEAGTMELYLNGEKREGRQRTNMTVRIRIPDLLSCNPHDDISTDAIRIVQPSDSAAWETPFRRHASHWADVRLQHVGPVRCCLQQIRWQLVMAGC